MSNLAETENVENKKTENEEEEDTAVSVVVKPIKQIIFAGSILIVLRQVLSFTLSPIIGSKTPLQTIWNGVLSRFGTNPFNYHVWGSSLITNGVFFSVGGIFMYFDLTGKPDFIRKYKIQPGTNEPLNKKRFSELLQQIIWNQLLFGILFNAFMYWLHCLRGTEGEIRTLPTVFQIVAHMIVFVAVEEILFFYSHWAMHKSRFLYTNIHKRHHEWQSTVAYAAIYAHPVEHLISNLLPAGLGPVLCGSHVVTTWLWYTIVIVNTLNSHSGYHLPYMPSPEAHDFHHLRFNQCFGVLGVLDYFHGTDQLFRSSKSFRRHVTLTTTQSAREVFPDN